MMPTMRTLAHLSDLHFGRIDSALLAPLRSAVESVTPDLIAISGDFTQRARLSEYAAARDFLDALHAPKLFVPGNHDVPLWNVAARFLTPLARYKAYISPELEPEYRDEEMMVVGVNTARSLTWGEGRINGRQVDRIVERLSGTSASTIRVIVTHHPFDLPPSVHERRLLGRAHMAMARLAMAHADLFLSGHLHLSHASHSVERYRIAGHSALIVQASFNVLRVARPRIELVRFVWDPASSRFAPSSAGQYRHTESGWVTEA
jgi:3',5'-cyclic AMP phosphodiesterase CpdA